VVIVDQLEEMFTLERFDSEQRRKFVLALGALCRSGLAWVVSTMRSDMYGRCGETMAKIGGDDGIRAQTLLQEALNLTDTYPGSDRQQLIDALNQALQRLPLD
jgi:conflict system STAND superfamily ATPase